MGRFDESQASFDKALQIENNMIQALNGKGTAYYYQKRYDEARKMWAQVLSLQPDDPTATENIATLVKMGL
jgi:Flp pilus assembly protein TadD